MPPYTVSEKTTYKMRENLISLSDDSFTIQDSSGKVAFKVNGSHLTLRERKTLVSAAGDKLYTMTEPVVEIGLRDSHYISDCETDDVLYTLKKKGVVMGRNSLMVWKGKGDTGEHVYTVSGSFFRKNYDIKDTSGKIIGEVDRKKFSLSSLTTGNDVYAISVEAGQDAALVIAIGVIIDEIYNEEEEKPKKDD